MDLETTRLIFISMTAAMIVSDDVVMSPPAGTSNAPASQSTTEAVVVAIHIMIVHSTRRVPRSGLMEAGQNEGQVIPTEVESTVIT